MTATDLMVKVNNDQGRVFGLVMFTQKPVENTALCLEYGRACNADLIVIQVTMPNECALFHIYSKTGLSVSAKQVAELFEGGLSADGIDEQSIISTTVEKLTIETVIRTVLQI